MPKVTYFLQLICRSDLRTGTYSTAPHEDPFTSGPIKIGATSNFMQLWRQTAKYHIEVLEPLRVVPCNKAPLQAVKDQFEKLRIRYDKDWYYPRQPLLRYLDALEGLDVGPYRIFAYGKKGRPRGSWRPQARSCGTCRRRVQFWRRPVAQRRSQDHMVQVDGRMRINPDWLKEDVVCPVCGGNFEWELNVEAVEKAAEACEAWDEDNVVKVH